MALTTRTHTHSVDAGGIVRASPGAMDMTGPFAETLLWAQRFNSFSPPCSKFLPVFS